MELKMFFGAAGSGDEWMTTAEVEVAGLGKVVVKTCISQETIDAIKAQVIEVVRQKLELVAPAPDKKDAK